MKQLKDYMLETTFFEILSSLDYIHMEESDKLFIAKLYGQYELYGVNMNFSDQQYARLNEIDFLQYGYIFNKNFKQFIKPYM